MANIYNSQLDAYSLYHQIQEERAPPSYSIGPALPALGHALAGSTGTAIANLATYPLDLIVTRLQVQRSLRKESAIAHEDEYKGVLDAFSRIYNEGGITDFYTGVLQDTGKSITDSFLFFLFYNYIRTKRVEKNGKKLAMLDELSVGALAGACSKFFTTPISNIVTRKQTASLVASRSNSKAPAPSVADIAHQIHETKGIQGFWSGYSASLVLTLNPSLTFFLYELFKRTLVPRSRRDDPGARTTFLMAAVSKAIASTVTYPFALAKARAQASSKPPVDPNAAAELASDAKETSKKTDAKKTGKEARQIAKRSTVFSAILQIYREEGLAALYEGVGGEIFKGFFSHGITMLVKEAVHKVIIQLYFFILKALGDVPSREEIQTQAGELATQASETVKDVSGKAGEIMSDAREKAGEVVSDAGEKIQASYASVSQSVGETIEAGKEQVGIVGERVGVVGSNATETAKEMNDLASKEAGHLLGNAQEMLGGKIPGVKNEE